MSCHKLLQPMIGIILTMMLLVGCDAPAPTPIIIVVTATPQPAPAPNRVSTLTPTARSSDISISGTVGRDIYYFYGTNHPDIWQYTFEITIKNSGFDSFHFDRIDLYYGTPESAIKWEMFVGEILEGALFSTLDAGEEISFNFHTDGETYEVIMPNVSAVDQEAQICIEINFDGERAIAPVRAYLPDLDDLAEANLPLSFASY